MMLFSSIPFPLWFCAPLDIIEPRKRAVLIAAFLAMRGRRSPSFSAAELFSIAAEAGIIFA